MKKLLLFFSLIVVLASCQNSYQYEVWERTGIFSDLADKKRSDHIIEAKSDSNAFVRAYMIYYLEMSRRLEADRNFPPDKFYFKLITKDGQDISNGGFLHDPESVKRSAALMSASSALKEYYRKKK